MSELFDDAGVLVKENLESVLGDDYYNDPETKQQPTKLFDNVKDEGTLIKNYVNAQRTISKGETAFAEKTKGMVKIPDDKATKEDIAAYHKAIGVPESAEKYELAIPDGDAKAGYEVIAKEVKQAAFEAGVPAGAISKVWAKVTATMLKNDQAMEQKGIELMKADETTLKEEWKEKYDANVKASDDALTKFKEGQAVKDLLKTYGIENHPAMRKLLLAVAPLVLEGKTIVGQGGGGDGGDGWPISYKYDPNTGKPME